MSAKRQLHHDRMINLFRRALDGGARRRSISWAEWSIAGDCLNPYHTEVMGRPRDAGAGVFHQSRWHTFTGGAMTMRVTLWTRCRTCPKCLKARSNEWRYRAREETARAGRTWFGTLTLSPSNQYRMLVAARSEAQRRGVDWSTLTDTERFRRRANTSLKEVTKYLKRVRKQAKVPLRYIVVTERHKSGLPHFHLLIHEVELKPVTHKILSSKWDLGFEKWRLLPHEDKRGAGYVTKYLTSDVARVKIHCSQHYGKPKETVGTFLAVARKAS